MSTSKHANNHNDNSNNNKDDDNRNNNNNNTDGELRARGRLDGRLAAAEEEVRRDARLARLLRWPQWW